MSTSPGRRRPGSGASVRVTLVAAAVAGACGTPLAAQVVDATRIVRAIGGIDGPPGEIFDRITSVHPLPGGRLLVADGGSRQLRVYGDAGPPATFGRQGEGPGEFLSLDWAAPYRADSLVAWDSRLGRLTVVSPDLTLGRTISLSGGTGASIGGGRRPSPSARLEAIGALSDGRLVARRGLLSVGPGDTTAVRRDSFHYVLLDEAGRFERELVTLPDDEQFVWAERDSRSVRGLAFGRTTGVDVRGSVMAWASNDGFRVRLRDLSTGAELVRAAERERARRTEDDRERWIAEYGPSPSLPPEFRRNQTRMIEAMPFPDRLPWHGRVVLGGEGSVWLEEYNADRAAAPVWTRFSSVGDAKRVRFPPGFRLTSVEGDRAYGVGVGELDVQRVTVIELP